MPIIENGRMKEDYGQKASFELFSLKKPVDCLPVTGAGTTKINGLSRG